MAGFKWFSNKEKREHYDNVASGKKATKKDSKFSAKEQRIYAKGRVDEMKEQSARYKSSHATEQEKRKYREEQRRKRNAYIVNNYNKDGIKKGN